MHLSQTCDEIEELHVVLGKQYEDAENLLNSNDKMTETGVYQRVCQFEESLFLSSYGTKLSLYYKECYTELHFARFS
jgi:hypothetical protein